MIWGIIILGVLFGFLMSIFMKTFKSGYGLSNDLYEHASTIKICKNCGEKIPRSYKKAMCPSCHKLIE
ncbi:hypothetical protein [Mangrovibacillus cuniculi]|uniref:Uncharacterized protein n=1 Tax=Mangrovibacillus cuniculi TaxID=2593652 RepID=A0A7S8C9G8_9BACI|nr:hypothetical protein [Mangrovibacillus cuniculi]QPC45828.1 hypothetical protein G8O30_02070 [Mangrovibacillus cuniculi]